MYFEKLHPITKAYFEILSSEIPDFLYEYVEIKELKRLNNITFLCGTDYCKLFYHKLSFSRLDHSVAVALIIWNFTKDKKQTIAGLLHDIAAPTFCHAVDFLNNDFLNQESIEDKTEIIIKNSKELMQLLKKDNLNLEDVVDYKIYPIADNKKPQLSSDRFEYSLSTKLIWDKDFDLEQIKRIYNDVTILENEFDIIELGFKTVTIAEYFVETACYVAKVFQKNEDKLALHFLADLLKLMIDNKVVSYDELFILDELELIKKIKDCNNKKIITLWEYYTKLEKIYRSNTYVNKYCISINVKTRYINPLVVYNNQNIRISLISTTAKNMIAELLNFKDSKYAYINLEAF